MSIPITPWRRVLEKLIVSQLAKKHPSFYGATKLIAMST
jgi:hypothetical protein